MPESQPTFSEDRPDEPLETSAALAWQQAQQTCRSDPAAGCLWNHGLWQFLRVIGLAGTAANRSSFYQRTLRTLLEKNPRPRILVSGSADYAMLAQIVLAARRTGASPMVTVVDICETPLQLNRWYAAQNNVGIDTVRSDMLEFSAAAPFDMVCTDSFLGRFPHVLWPQVAARWRALLQPGGRLLTASQLRPASDPDRLAFDENRIAAFRGKVFDNPQRQRAQAALGLTDDELFAAITQYCRQQSNHPLRSEPQLRSLLENAGFGIDELPIVTSASISYRTMDAPTVPNGGKFLCVVATRH